MMLKWIRFDIVIEVLKFYIDRGDLEGDRRQENSLYAKGGGYAH